MKKRVRKTTKNPGPVEAGAAFAQVAAAFSGERGVTRDKGWGSGSEVLKCKGKIFAMSVRGKLVAKLPKSRVDELVLSGTGVRFDPRGDGRLMKEWVVVEDEGAPWAELAREAYLFVRKR
ncbi:MAG TPA: hypothetical protein VKH43_11750 [Thermoanaerobaculia bacterium]|nr:hypothetical protein [Thermoanaerobaculia bacterium]